MGKTSWLTTDVERSTFRDRYRALAHSVSMHYLRRARVRGFFDDSGRMVGGYAIHHGPSLRYLAAMPPDLDVPAFAERDALCEVTCIWFDRSMSRTRRLLAYGRLALDLLRHGRRHIVGGSTEPRIARLQRKALPHVAYEGPVRIAGAEHWGCIYYGSMATVVRGLLREVVHRVTRR